jgi:hypothetical protein
LRFGPSALWTVYRASQRPSFRREIEPSPLPRLPTILSLHQFVGFYSESFGELANRARLGTVFLIFEFVDVVECHAASLAQLTQTEHPVPPKLPELHPVYLYKSLNHTNILPTFS